MRPYQKRLLILRRNRRHSQPQRLNRKRLAWAGLAITLSILLLAGLLATAGAWVLNDLSRGFPDEARIQSALTACPAQTPTRFFDRSGTRILYTLGEPSLLAECYSIDGAAFPARFPDVFLAAVTAVEQPDFWRSSGIRWSRLADPQPHTLIERFTLETFLEQEPPSHRRALRMRLLAARLISQHGKQALLAAYLNTAWYGQNVWGADAAARLYLGNPLESISLRGAAQLAAIHAHPQDDPFTHPQAALRHGLDALSALRQADLISAEQYEQASDATLLFAPAPQAAPPGAFIQYAREQATRTLGAQRLAAGGLAVITSQDAGLQDETRCVLLEQIARAEGGEPGSGASCASTRLLPTLLGAQTAALSASAVVLDPANGEVLALVGDLSRSQADETLLPHPPGSLLTPFVAAAAFTRGWSPASLVWDLPPAGSDFFAADYQGPLRLRNAIAGDVLAPLEALTASLDAQFVWSTAARLGMPGLNGRSVALTSDLDALSPLELAAGYAVFAGQGSLSGQTDPASGVPQPNFILTITSPAGETLADFRQARTVPLLSPAAAFLVHDVLADRAARWSSLGQGNPLEIGYPSAAKLGRNADGSQVWAAGYTQRRLAVIWLGNDPAQPSVPAALDGRLAGGIWHAIMQTANRSLPPENWQQPAGLTRLRVCDPSGLLPGPDCPAQVEELFLAGSEPTQTDTLFQRVALDRETGRLATAFTRLEMVEQRVVMQPPAAARAWAQAAGLALAPADYAAIPLQPVSTSLQISAPQPLAPVSGLVSIHGTANGEKLKSWNVQVGAGINPTAWLQLGETHTSSVEDGELAVWNTSGLQGLYTLRLAALFEDEHLETALIQVQVENQPENH